MESLESRAMLAFAPLPMVGDMLGNPIILSSNASGPNDLTIVLDDVTKSDIGAIAATITTNDGQAGQYWNFSGITYTASNDTDGAVVNTVKLWTSYEADVAGFETAPADDSEVGLATSWFVASGFPAGGAPVVVSMLNADSLTVTSGVIGGNPSTIAGEFESPTLAPDLDATTGARITLISGTGVTGADLDGTTDFEPIVAYTLTLQSQTAGVQLGTDVFTVGDLTINAAGTITLDGLLQSTSGDIEVESTSGQILLDGAELHALDGAITLRTLKEGIVQVPATAQNPRWQDYIVAETDVSIEAGGEVRLIGGVRANTGDIELSSTDRGIQFTGENAVLHAVAGSVQINATRGPATLQNLFANKSITVNALGDVSLNGTFQTTSGDLVVTSDGNISNSARLVIGGSLTLHSGLNVSSLGGGIVRLELLSGGSDYEYAIVTIAPPAAGGGRAALARATVSGGQVTALTIVDPGFGYAPNEQVAVSIDGNPATGVNPAASGARATAFAGSTLSSMQAGKHLIITAGTAGDISNELRAESGKVTVAVSSGPLSLSDIFAGEGVSLTAAQTIDLGGLVRTAAGDVSVKSTGGGVGVGATLLAPAGGADVTAAGQIVQRGGSVSRDRLFLLSGGRDYTYALVVVDPPPGAGQAALARAVITYYNPLDPAEGGFISDIVLLDPGWGYPSDSRVNVSIQGDGEGAEVVFATDIVTSSIDVRDDVTVQAGDAITLVSSIRSSAGSVTLRNSLGDLAVQSVTSKLFTDVESARGKVSLVSVAAGGSVDVAAFRGVSVTDSVNTTKGDIAITTTDGDLQFLQGFDFGDNYLVDADATLLQPLAVIATADGAIELRSDNGSITTPFVINATDDVTITSFGLLEATNEITSTNGDVELRSTSGLVQLDANVSAAGGSITVNAHTQLKQRVRSGVSKIQLLSPGEVVEGSAPQVTVTVAAPRNGGTAATAMAIIERRSTGGGFDDEDDEYFLGAIAIIDAGQGYAVDEQPLVTIAGINGAAARAYGPLNAAMLSAGEGISLRAGEDLTLISKIHAVDGTVTVASTAGDIDLTANSLVLSSKAGGIDIDAYVGSIDLRRAAGFTDVTIDAHGAVTLLGTVDSVAGNVAITSRSGNLDFTAYGALIYAEGGSVNLAAANGSILTPPTLNVARDVSITSLNTVSLRNEITSKVGDITVESISGSITTNANINAIAGSVTLDAHGAVTQLGRGINSVEVLTGGSGYNAATTVTIDAPVGGGVTATARPVIGANGAIIGIVIVNPGSGYGADEQPAVTITPAVGFAASGANALANVTQGVIAIAAGENVTIDAGNGVTLINPVNSVNGDIVIATTNGNVDASGANVVIGAQNGGVSIDSVNGQILAPPVLNVAGDIALRTFGTLSVVNSLTSQGSITLESRHGAVAIGTDPDGANLVADGRVTLLARQGISQGPGFIKAQELVVNNATTQPVTLTNGGNDVENLSIRSLGAVSYTDANEFETGVNRTGVLGIEVEGDAVQLASLAPYSKVRVVSGMKYRTLSISAGANTPSTVGTVEFVTTSSGDNPGAAFQGSLRDMIRYANDNVASYVINGSRRQQPQAMVFDEDGYAVSEITVAAALPQFSRTVTFDGGRLESTVAADRLGVRGNGTAETGLAFGLGSSESRITTVAAYGFDTGSAIALYSSGNVVTDVYAGLMADGVTSVPNRVGIDVNGKAAIGNIIGDRVFDEAKVNRVVGNKASGIVIRNGASATNVSGNRIYDNLGDGIRITKAVGNLIGDPRAVHPDMTAADSNIIAGNRSNGILVINSNGGTFATANRIRNNRIEANQGVNIGVGEGAGIGIRGSKFTVIGGPLEGAGNTIVNQGPGGSVHGIAAVDSTDIRIIGVGNAIGVDLNTMTKAGNSGDGINLLRSQRVEISDRNTIAGNAGNGIAIGAGSSAVTVLGNAIGLAASDPSRADLGNALSGVKITEAIGNTVGAGNAIAFNGFHGVNVTNSRAATLSTGNRVFGSEIFANFKDGVRINGGSGTTVGGTKASDANVIRGNLGSGIRLERTAATGAATGHLIQGNLIGATSNREVDPAMGNGGAGIRIVAGTSNTIAGGNVVMNNAGDGIELQGGSGNVVGGTAAGVSNTITNNAGSGIRIGAATGVPTTMAQARGHVVAGNSIVENGADGVVVDGTGVAGVTIGQHVTATRVSGVGNEIVGNVGYGILVKAGAQQVSFHGNSITDNELGGVRVEPGANRSSAVANTFGFERHVYDSRTKRWVPDQLHRDHVDQSVLIRQTRSGTNVEIYGMFSNPAGKLQQYSVDVYANSPYDRDAAGGVQHRRYLGRVTVVADSNGVVDFRRTPLSITANIEAGEIVTLTATSLRFEAGSTVAFSGSAVAELPGVKHPVF